MFFLCKRFAICFTYLFFKKKKTNTTQKKLEKTTKMSETDIQKDNKKYFELLRTFVLANDWQAIETLLEIKKDIDLNAHVNDGFTLCGLAALNNYPRVFEVLCKAGAKLDISREVGNDSQILLSPVRIAQKFLSLDASKKFERIAQKYSTAPVHKQMSEKTHIPTEYSKETIAIWRMENYLPRNGGYFGIKAKANGWFFSFYNHDYLYETTSDWFVSLEKIDKSTPVGTFTDEEQKANNAAFSLIDESLSLYGSIFIKKKGPKWTIIAMGTEYEVTAPSMAQALQQVDCILIDGEEPPSEKKITKVQNKVSTEYAVGKVLDHFHRLTIEKTKEGKWSLSFGDHGICSMKSTDEETTWPEALRNFSAMLADH